MQVILASQSPYRKAQLERFGIPFKAQSPQVNEEELKRQGPQDLVELTRFLAEAKARSLASLYPEAVVIGSDQIAEFEGERLDKPGSLEKALHQLQRLAGHTHRLVTSLAVIAPSGGVAVETEITRLKMRPVVPELLQAYVDLDRPSDCAGAYKIERAGLALIESIEGSDPSAIEGLPLIGLTRALHCLGISLTQLWRKSP